MIQADNSPTRPFRVLYEASLGTNPAGTGTFVRGLLSGLQSRPELELRNSALEVASLGELDSRQKTALSRLASGARHLDYYARTLPRRAAELECDVIFCPSSLVPLRGRLPYLMTIFDATPWRFAATQDRLSRFYVSSMLSFGVRGARGVCTISQAVRGEILEHFPALAPSMVQVAYPGPNPELLAAEPVPVDLPARPYVLMVGTVEPRKNHVTALRALAGHVARHPRSELLLVVAGSAGWRSEPVARLIRELKLGDRVVFPGGVGSGALKWLYQHARALLFPSLYEGFGLPILEAMYLECPIVAARIPSVAEIIGPEGTLLEPADVVGWTDALDQLLEAEAQPGRVLSARLRAQRFNWTGCAASVVEAIAGAWGQAR